jgi:hypothetical protein
MKLLVIVIACLCLSACVSANECGVISNARRCNTTTCYWAETTSGCNGDVHLSEPICSDTYWVWFDVVFGDMIFRLFESPEKQVVGYSSAEDAFVWEQSIVPGTVVNCSLTNGTAFISTASVTDGGRRKSRDVTKKGLFWVPMIIIICCIGALIVALAIGVVTYVARAVKKTEDKF